MSGKLQPAVSLYLRSPDVGVLKVYTCELMCKNLSLLSVQQQGWRLEVTVSANPMVMREGISSSPHSSPLDLPLSLSVEMESTAY